MNGIGIPRGLHFDPDDAPDTGIVTDPDSDDKDSDPQAPDNATKLQLEAVIRDLRDERKARKEAERKAKELVSSGPTAEEIAELREFKAKQAAADEDTKKKKGQYEQLLKDNTTKYESEINKIRSEHTSLLQQYRDEKIDATLSRHIPTYTTIPVSDVADLMRRHFTFDDEGEMVIQVGGTEPMNDRGNPMSAEEFISDFINKRDYLAKAAPKGGSGGQGGKGKGSGKNKVWTPEELQSMSHEDFKKNEREITAQINA